MEIIYPRGSLGTEVPLLGAGVAELPGIPSAGPWLTPSPPPSWQDWGPCPPVLLALSPVLLAVPSPGRGNVSVPDSGRWGVQEPPGPTLAGPFSASRQHCHCRSRGATLLQGQPRPYKPFLLTAASPAPLRGRRVMERHNWNSAPAGLPGIGAQAEPRCASARTSSPPALAHGDHAPQKHHRPT